jgi:hypothetical protein
MKKKEARSASHPVVPVEAPSTLRFLPLLCFVIFFLTQGLFYKILAYNLSRYYICLSYCCYICDLNILSTRIEASVSSSQNRGMTGSFFLGFNHRLHLSPIHMLYVTCMIVSW